MKKKINNHFDRHENDSSSQLRPFFLLVLYMLVLLSPFWRGLYFERELLPAVVLAAIAFVLCVLDQVVCKDYDSFREPLDFAMAALLLAYILSTITAVHRHDAIVELLKVSSMVMVYWMAVRAGQNQRDFRRVLLAAYLAAVGMAVIGLGAALGWVHMAGAYEQGHIRSALQYHNALAIYLAAMNIVGLAMSLGTARFSRMAFSGGNYLLLVVILGSLSRGTWLLYLIAMVVFIFLIPASYRRSSVYQLLITIGIGLQAGRFFFNNLDISNEPVAAAFLISGLIMAMVLSMITVAPLSLKSKWARKGIAIGLVLLAVYIIANPVSLTGVMRYILPDRAIARAQKTSVQDNSFQERLTTYQDALKIIKDYPLTGTGGGGWRALYHSYASHLYWVNEVHNYYLQTWLEAGSLGFLALLGVAFFFLRKLIQIKALQMEDHDRVLLWAAATAVTLIALHSSFDFELSIPAVGFLFFALIGLVRGKVLEAKIELPVSQNKSLLVLGVLGGLLGTATGIMAFFYHTASIQADQGAYALEAGRLAEAQGLYTNASSLDPYAEAYHVNLAQIAAIKAVKGKEVQAVEEAIYHARKAAQLEPYNPSLHAALASIYAMLGRVDLQLTELEAAIRSNPFQPEPYELLAAAAMKSAWSCLDQGQYQEAFSYLERVLAAREKMPENISGSAEGLNLAAGQSALLMGKTKLAKNYLNLVAQGKESYKKTARLWLAGVDYMQSQGSTNDTEANLNNLLAFFNQQKG